jgi:hypothetical protein
MRIDGMSETMAHSLFQSGFGSLELLSQSLPEHVMHVPGYEEEAQAADLINKAKVAYEQFKVDEAEKAAKAAEAAANGEGDADADSTEPSKTPNAAPKQASNVGKDAKSLADERLKEQMAELNSESNASPDTDGDTNASAVEAQTDDGSGANKTAGAAE